MSRVLNLLLTHLGPEPVEALLDHWRTLLPGARLLLLHGGERADFDAIPWSDKLFVEDPRLRTQDHQREMQSYARVFRAVSDWLAGRDYTHVYFSEYDHLPLVADLNARQLARLEQEGADVLGHHVRRVDGTNQPHYLYHLNNREFAAYWHRLTLREDGATILSMFGTGSFWTRSAFDAVARQREPFPMYLEIYLPTLAHHLGYRVRDFAEQNRYIQSLGNLSGEIKQARRAGAWTIHPIKAAG